MSADPGDLANLADIVLPPAVPFWPPAAGVWIVGAVAGAMLAVAGRRALRRYRADAYLRLAAKEIDDGLSPNGDGTDVAISAILKRAAMVAYGRERVASLTGAAWTEFLAASAPGAPAFALSGSWAKAWLSRQRGRVSREA
ncbi:DUF4381 domain-containing protein [Bosea caraganae]|uniref:DUF4381 domain-containing protein n=1 Tax=Bosea caraganae TaxID=2763117 RepID=A0A370KXI5_9HYPH|nr:DUF4381 domain-containing protein [Bosea caraganae]RDJ19681.1 DUF4381 domain-containing protein [Bosea caraganae]RDJ23825.1 DUF4381 domain-containing protein [Bosea caraganae]